MRNPRSRGAPLGVASSGGAITRRGGARASPKRPRRRACRLTLDTLYDARRRRRNPSAPYEELTRLVTQRGPQRWPTIASAMSTNRIAKQCRERWYDHLDPTVNKGPFTHDEVRTILVEHHKLGNKWATIAHLLPGRTDMAVKNYWTQSLRGRFELFAAEEVEPTLDVPVVLEKIRRTYVAKARREAEGNVECARKIPA